MFRKNNRYLIKTPTGYESFKGIQKKNVNDMFTFTFTDNTSIKCSGKHAFLTENGFVHAKELTLSNTISGKSIKKIDVEYGTFEVFDPVGVDKHSTYYSNDVVSHNTEFLGSSNTLISATKLKLLLSLCEDPIEIDNRMKIYERPKKGNTYCMTVDVAEGQGLDSSAFAIIDVTTVPYKLVATWRDNKITPVLLPGTVVKYARMYNDAFILVEINSIGLQVSDAIHFELGYENLLKIQVKGKQGQIQTPGFTKKVAFGLKQTKQTKMIGCTNLKALIENDKIILRDETVYQELTTFVSDKQTFKAEDGCNDDMVMTLVNFGWLTGQRVFKENVNSNIRQMLQEEQMKLMDEDLLPFGIIDNGLDDPFKEDWDYNGEKWAMERESTYVFDSVDWDILRNKHRL